MLRKLLATLSLLSAIIYDAFRCFNYTPNAKYEGGRMKRLEAIIAATIITGVVALSMLLIGINALLNTNSVSASNSPTTTALNAPAPAGVDQTQLTQYQTLISQYQGREKQYQAQLDQANTQLEQYQQVLSQLQSAGVIRITSDGRILLRGGGGGGDD
jgi:uncharacterized protein HemX